MTDESLDFKSIICRSRRTITTILPRAIDNAVAVHGPRLDHVLRHVTTKMFMFFSSRAKLQNLLF